MKVTRDKSKEDFQPIRITITLGTEEEVKALYMVCNYTPIIDAASLFGLYLGNIKDALGRVDYGSSWSEFTKKLEARVRQVS